MTSAMANTIDDTGDKVFEVQATIAMLLRRFEGIVANEIIARDELFNLSRVTDLCVRTLDDVASLLDELVMSDQDPVSGCARPRTNR